MKKLLFLPIVLIIVIASCSKKDTPQTNSNDVPVVSQFVYDGLSLYYLWADEMADKKPTSSNTDPEAYFNSVLNDTDKQHGWSWITDDVNALLADFSGTPLDFGWGLSLLWTDASRTELVAFVNYVYPNTPAANAGIIRGNIIDKIDGAVMTLSNYTKLFESNNISVVVNDQNYQNPRTVSITPATIQTNPVLKDTVYNDNSGHRIGYLFYTAFIDNFNTKLYEAFNKFKTAGVTDLVLDLRYNHGGSIHAAAFLASLIAPRTVVQSKSVFTILSYNNFLNNYFDTHDISRKDSFINAGNPNPLNANLNLSKIYIIATGDSYSASELLTFCLKPYMTVEHIGGNTGGKFTGSWTIHAYDDFDNRAITVYEASDLSAAEKSQLQNWAMQPIVAKYTDKNGSDFVNPGWLVPDYPVTSIENNTSNWKPLGDKTDYLLSKAISVITGVPVSGAVNPATLPRSVYGFRDARLFSPRDSRIKESVQLNPPKKAGVGPQLFMKLKQERPF